MPFKSVRWEARIRREGGERLFVLPPECVLEGEEISILQDKWGDIVVTPTSAEGRKALEIRTLRGLDGSRWKRLKGSKISLSIPT